MKKVLLLMFVMAIGSMSNAMDHAKQVRSYILGHEWTELIGYMVDNNLTADFLQEIHKSDKGPKNLDLGVGQNRLLVKFIIFIRAKKNSSDRKQAAATILKSLIAANKFDLKNIQGFDGEMGKTRRTWLNEIALEAQGQKITDQEQKIADFNNTIWNMRIVMGVGIVAVVAAELYIWHKARTENRKKAVLDEDENSDDEQEETNEENKAPIIE